MHSQAGGLSVNIIASKLPQYERRAVDGDPTTLRIDPEYLLKKSFPASPDLDGVLKEFREFEGMWKACYPGQTAFALAHPVFNQRGDLLFELRPHSQHGDAGGSPRNRGNRKNAHGLWNGTKARSNGGRGMFSFDKFLLLGLKSGS